MKLPGRFLALSALAVACLGFLAVPRALAGVTIELKLNGRPQTLYAQPHMFSTSEPDNQMVFRGDKKVMWVIDLKDRTYAEMTEADARALAETADDAMAKIQEALKNVPPEQREMAEKMMSGKLPKPKSNERVVKPLEQTKTINGFECRGYLARESDGAETEIWAAEPGVLKVDPKDLGGFREFAELWKPVLSESDPLMDMAKDHENPKEGDIPGLPVLSIHKNSAGIEVFRSEIVKVESGPIPPERFEVPEGFKEKKRKD